MLPPPPRLRPARSQLDSVPAAATVPPARAVGCRHSIRRGPRMGAAEPQEDTTSTNEQEKPLVFHDPWVYRLAIGGIGAALVAFLVCGGIIGATNHAQAMVKEYWTIGAALSGALVGIIAPSPRQKKESAHSLAASDNVITKTEKAQISLAPIYQPLLLLVA